MAPSFFELSNIFIIVQYNYTHKHKHIHIATHQINMSLKRSFEESTTTTNSTTKKPKITTVMSAGLIKQVRSRLEETLQDIAKEFGLKSFDIGTITYDENGPQFSTKITGFANAVDANGQFMEKSRIKWNKHCQRYGLCREDWGKTIFISDIQDQFYGENVTFHTIETKNTKYKIILKRPNGKSIGLTKQIAWRYLGELKEKQNKEKMEKLRQDSNNNNNNIEIFEIFE